MRTTLKLGKISGIPIQVHLNWFLVAGLVTWSLARGFFPRGFPDWDQGWYWLAAIATALLFFLSVLAHELGHALVAVREGVPVRSITLFIFGGIAHIAREPETARAEFRIVGAGPLASFLLAGLFGLVAALPGLGPEIRSPAVYLSWINLVLGLFNLLPGFPLDGGRLLRALLWAWGKDYQRATRWAVFAGLIIAGLFMLGGTMLMLFGNPFNGLWLAFIGWYLAGAARGAYRQSQPSRAQGTARSIYRSPQSRSVPAPALSGVDEPPVPLWKPPVPLPREGRVVVTAFKKRE